MKGQMKYLSFPVALIIFVVFLQISLSLGLQSGERIILILFGLIISAGIVVIAWSSD